MPAAPSSLIVTNTNLDSLTLEWSPPHDRNGLITGYTLKYQPGECFFFLEDSKLIIALGLTELIYLCLVLSVTFVYMQ